jgi:alkanesulfonate monooxygenase SsuD/methylene tetrahydromethanopterin reductase-like flavin-dependent oxidoreductase (luciferase family)
LARRCERFPALWRGEAVTDPELGLEGTSLGPLGIDPPTVFVGGAAEDTLTSAVDHADGWNAVVEDAERFRELGARVDELCRDRVRARPVRKAAQVFLRDVELSRARRLVGDLDAVGAEGVTFVLVEERGPEAVLRLAEAVL